MESCNVVQFKQSVFRLIRRSSVDALRVVDSVKVRLMALWPLNLIVTPHALSLLILSGVSLCMHCPMRGTIVQDLSLYSSHPLTNKIISSEPTSKNSQLPCENAMPIVPTLFITKRHRRAILAFQEEHRSYTIPSGHPNFHES